MFLSWCVRRVLVMNPFYLPVALTKQGSAASNRTADKSWKTYAPFEVAVAILKWAESRQKNTQSFES